MNLIEKAFYEINITKNEREYRFSIPIGAPFGEAYDAAFEALRKVVQKSQESLESVQKPEQPQGE